MNFEFTPVAFRTLYRIARRYNRAQKGSGGEFIDEVYRVVGLLAVRRWMGKRRGRYREYPILKTRYVLECFQKDHVLEITSIVHKRRRRRSLDVREPAVSYAVADSCSADRAAA